MIRASATTASSIPISTIGSCQRWRLGDTDRLARYSRAELAAAGAGAFELLSWIALAGALAGRKGETVVYEAVKPWATGIGMMTFAQAVAA